MDEATRRRKFGDDYPRVLTWSGIRMPLTRESRFARHFFSATDRHGSTISRFHDGTAAITLDEIRREWSAWSEELRRDFCGGCSWLHDQPDFPDILRHIAESASDDEWSSIALSVAVRMPQAEALMLLSGALSRCREHRANLLQAIAHTKHPVAAELLQATLDELWRSPRLRDDDPRVSEPFDAICCIKYLLELGRPAVSCEERVRELAAHPSARIRDICARYLRQSYPWLPEPRRLPRPGAG